MISAGIVADANVLLSAALGKAASRVFSEFRVPVHTTLFNAGEVEEYLPRLSIKYGISLDVLQLQWDLLPLHVHDYESYKDYFEAAERDLASLDPEDAHPLALARALSLPLWSNDSDLAETGVVCYTTARLLKILAPTG
ncbi:MAG TPA: PIN domain-containing protein [Thermoanaerobaculia bacterium]